MLSTPFEKVDSYVVELLERLAQSEKENRRLEREAATRSGLDCYAGALIGKDGFRRVILRQTLLDENARSKAKAFASQPKAILLMHSDEGLLLACSVDSGINAGSALKQALAKFGARGGGSPSLAQGGLPDPLILTELKESLRLSEPGEKRGDAGDK